MNYSQKINASEINKSYTKEFRYQNRESVTSDNILKNK